MVKISGQRQIGSGTCETTRSVKAATHLAAQQGPNRRVRQE
jgi:hypothetical protein